MLNCVDVSKSSRNLYLDHDAQLLKPYIRFGSFELRTDTRELTKQGIKIKLQSKPARVLEILAARPGELVRRDELCRQLWPASAFVDIESGLNTAMNRLRAALGDTAETPRYIETIPRLGYRFIGQVEDGGVRQPQDEPVDTFIDLPSNRFPEHMFLRLTLATMLVLGYQLVMFCLDACLVR